MKVIQIIDSLEAGGAERMAVSIANGLSEKTTSFLCSTRKEGQLKNAVQAEVNYCYLNKKRRLDIKAFLSLRSFIKKNDISLVHAHSSSFFIAVLMKMFNPSLRLIWHIHLGSFYKLSKSKLFFFKLFSRFFSAIIVVNSTLEKWVSEQWKHPAVYYLPNFPSIPSVSEKSNDQLQGEKGKRIICLANLRPEKDHLNLLKAFAKVKNIYPDWSLHMVGNDLNDAYSDKIKVYVKEHDLQKNVHFYGSLSNIPEILSQCEIGVLSSSSEGLPLSLLEYGMCSLAVVATHVGDCYKVIPDIEKGVLVPPRDPESLADGIMTYIKNEKIRKEKAKNINDHIKNKYTKKRFIEALIGIYEAI